MDPHSLSLPHEWLPQSIVINRPEYVVSYAQFGPCTFVHVAVHAEKFPRKAFADDIQAAFKLHGGPVYAIAATDKQKRFDMMFGFEPTGVSTADGEVLIKKE